MLRTSEIENRDKKWEKREKERSRGRERREDEGEKIEDRESLERIECGIG